MATDYLFQQSEVVSKRMPEFFGRFQVASNLVKKGDVDKINERDYRTPFLTQEGGRFGTYDPDGGAIGRGSASKGGVMVSSYFPFRLNFELTELAVKATENSQIAQFNAFKRAMKSALPEMATYVDKAFHGDGTAKLATATATGTWASGAKTTYTLDTATGLNKLRRGQYVIVYDTGGATARDSGAAVMISMIDYDNRIVYLNGAVTGAAATDELYLEGVTGATPTGPNGLYYFNSYATSGTTLGVDRALEPEVIANSVNCSGVPTFQKGLQILHKIIKRRGEIPKGLTALCSPEQQANIYQQVLNIAQYDLAKGKVSDDLIPGVDLKWKFAGVQAMLDIHQQTDRLDYILPTTWKRAQLADVGFHEVGGQRFFTLYGADGGPAASLWFGLTMHQDWVCDNPGVQGVLYGCTQPTY